MGVRTMGVATAALLASMASALAQAPAEQSAQMPPPAPAPAMTPGPAMAPPPPAPEMAPPPVMVSGMDWTGFYLGVNGGAEWGRFPGNITLGPTPATTGPGGTAAAFAGGSIGLRNGYSGAITGGGQAGYNWQWNNWVLGAEGEFRADGLQRSGTLLGSTGAGFIAGDSFAARQYWDGSARLRLGYAWDRWLLYATGGVAFSDVNLQASFVPIGVFPASSASQTQTLVGGTVGAGLEVRLSPWISLGAEYRYTDFGSATYGLGQVAETAATRAGSSTFNNAPVSGKVSLEEQTVLAKLNFHFNPPPPPPPAPAAMPAPPPAAPKVFIVFFDWDRDTITPDGMQIIQQAADAYKSGAPVQIQVTGYTDRSGSAGYNQRLSERRANNVAKALASLGVPKEQMIVTGRGENDNRVPTANGVREPQNRRVEIVE